MSRISTSDRLAKVLAGQQLQFRDVRVRSPSVLMPIFCKQLRLRTDSSKSLTEIFKT